MGSEKNAFQPEQERYFINQELFEEMVRLNRQGRLMTEGMGGVLPEQEDLSRIRDILDLACGPGEWALEVARMSPEKRLVGVDLSKRMIEYASAQARLAKSNVTFQEMDITNGLGFPDESFDLINSRMIAGFMKKEGWPRLLAECLRVLRPGGVLRVTESEVGATTSTIIDTLNGWWCQAFRQADQIFSFPGQPHMGITIVMKRLLSEAGYVNPGHQAHAIDYSFGTEMHESILENFIAALKLGTPFLLRQKVATKEQIQEVLEQAQGLIGEKDFCGFWFFVTVWAYKSR